MIRGLVKELGYEIEGVEYGIGGVGGVVREIQAER